MHRVLAVLVVLVGSACGSGGGVSTLDGTEWLSVGRTAGGEEWPLVDGTRIQLSFTDGQVSASAGCNTIGGTYRLDGDVLVFEGGGMTEMGCDEPRHAQDDWLAGFLGARPTFAHDGDKLTLTAGDQVAVLQDRAVADPDLPLTGTTWTVDSLITGGAVSSVPGAAAATIVLTDGGAIEVDTGCNSGSGRYEVTGSTLRITDLVVTEIGCDGPAGQLETAVLHVLGAEEVEIAVDHGSLTLMAGDLGLALRGS